MELDNILSLSYSYKASDINLKTGRKILFRVHKELIEPREFPEPLTQEDLKKFIRQIVKSDDKLKLFEEKGELDISYSLPGVSRYRVNIYKQRNSYAIALRALSTKIPPFETLELPVAMLKTTISHTKGLILVTGPTGSGKSTTLASLIDRLNEERANIIITIEDPIEYLFTDKKSFIAQREIGTDTQSFANGLRAALREDPDIIMVGEIRDTETALIALQAAETGHLVFATLHTIDAKETINRIIGMFPLENRGQIRLSLAGSLVAIFSQRLLPRIDKPGVIPAVEVLINTETIRDCILKEEKLEEIPDFLRKGNAVYGTQDFDLHLEELYKKGYISLETALLYASKPADLELRLKGIGSGAASQKDDLIDYSL